MGRKVCCLCLVESATECRTRDRDVFCAVSLSGAMWAATQAFEPADPGGARFLEHPAAACPRLVTQAGRDFLELTERTVS